MGRHPSRGTRRRRNSGGDSPRSEYDDEQPSPSKRARRQIAVEKGLELHDPSPPLAEFLKMKSFRRVQLDGMEYRVDQDVYIMPPESGAELRLWPDKPTLWCGRIRKIRCPDPTSPEEIWVHVSWYYSPKDFTTLNVKDFDEEHCGSNELIHVPTHMDIIHASTIDGPAPVVNFLEDDYDMDFSNKSLYCRSEFDHISRTWARGGPSKQCLCKVPFKLDNDSLMHLCANPSCNMWYHAECLQEHGYIQKNMTQARIEREWERSLDEERCDFVDRSLVNNRGFQDPEDDDDDDDDDDGYDDELYDSLPDELLALARRPINRGELYSVFGNAAVVLRARYLVRLVVKHGRQLAEDWDDFVWLKEDPSVEPADEEGTSEEEPRMIRRAGFPKYRHMSNGQRVVCYYCPRCRHPL